jgi:C-3',4' desaturase CrtD
MSNKAVIIGAGYGGLTTAAELARAGWDVTVLEAHIYPGGCGGTFYHQGYIFEAGATLAGGFAPGAPMDLLGKHFGIDWGGRRDSLPMMVHLLDYEPIHRWSDSEQWRDERQRMFGTQTEPFWEWQENTADALWDFALRLPLWPPQRFSELCSLIQSGSGWIRTSTRSGNFTKLPRLVADAFSPVATHLPDRSGRLRLFVDAQLLIASQTTSPYANALYGAVALDLPRQGVVHLMGGIGSMASKLVDKIAAYGGEVRFRHEVTCVIHKPPAATEIHTKRDGIFTADAVIFNLPPWNISGLIEEELPKKLRRLPKQPHDGWGAFMLYLGITDTALPSDFPLHHQVVTNEPLAEGNSVFLSISPIWDHGRAPTGKRAITISSHTKLSPWWELVNDDPQQYETRKEKYQARMLSAAEYAIPGLQQAIELMLPATPVTFQRFTRRAWGWVGGFPQTSLFRTWGPRLAKDVWMVGDSIFPGQSIPSVMLGGLRTARAILSEKA